MSLKLEQKRSVTETASLQKILLPSYKNCSRMFSVSKTSKLGEDEREFGESVELLRTIS